MQNKIIIGDIDVSGCEYYDEERPTLTCTCEEYHCSECYNCYYKQLKAKEQECEKLKIQLMQKSEVDTFFNTPIEGWDNDSCKICEYKQNYQAKEQECEKLKTQILLLQTMEIEELKNYKQSLDEIKEIMKKYCRKCKKHKFYHFKLCYTCKYTDILQKISECEVENERN